MPTPFQTDCQRSWAHCAGDLSSKPCDFPGKAAHLLNVTPAHPVSELLAEVDFQVPGGTRIWKKITVLLSPSGPNLVKPAGRLASVALASADTASCDVSG